MSNDQFTEAPQITVSGRLSYPVFTMAEAIERDKTSKYPAAKPEYIAPNFNLLLDQKSHDKVLEFFLDELLPYFVEVNKQNEDWGLSAVEAKRIEKLLRSGDLEDQPPYIPLKPVPEKTQELAPEAVSMIKINGRRGANIKQLAVIESAEELNDNSTENFTGPAILPIEETVHTLYAGCVTGAKLGFYATKKAKPAGFQARATSAVFKSDADSFSAFGDDSIDYDDLFMDD